jgi:tetratricopeptide (TPR) repeat protein
MRTRFFLLAAVLIAFGASVGSGFHFDDYAIFSDPILTSPSGWIGVWAPRQTRPLTYFTFWLNYQVGGGDPLGYHFLNLALHLGVVLLLFECLRRLMPETAAAVAAAIFAVHPIQAEAVDYVWGRAIVLATLLCLAAFYEWIEGREWAAVAWFAAALLAKEEVAAFPLALAVLPKTKGRPWGAAWWSMIGLAAAAGLRVVWAISVTPGVAAGVTPWHYLLAQGTVILRYLRLVVVPYGFTVDPDVRVPAVWLGVAAWVVVAAMVRAGWKYSRWAVAGFLLLIPSSTVFAAADLAADRRMYLPMVFFAVVAAQALRPAMGRPGGLPYLALAIIVIFAGLGFARTHVWMTERGLWTEAVERAPRKVRPKIQLARALPAAQALELLAKAEELDPRDPAVPAEIGKTLLAEGQADAALNELGRALALDPHNALYVNNRGVALAALGQTDAARADFERAIAIDPHLAEARQNLLKLQGK